MNRQTAIVAGGCFWCTEAVFLEVDGVLSVESGYCGGQTSDSFTPSQIGMSLA